MSRLRLSPPVNSLKTRGPLLQNEKAVLRGWGGSGGEIADLTKMPHFFREDTNLLIEAIEVIFFKIIKRPLEIFCNKVTKKSNWPFSYD